MSKFNVGDVVVCDDKYHNNFVATITKIEISPKYVNVIIFVRSSTKRQQPYQPAIFYEKEVRLATEMEKILYE